MRRRRQECCREPERDVEMAHGLNRKYLCRNIVDVSWKKLHMFTLGRIFLHLGHSANVTLLKCVYKDNQIPFSLW